MSSHQKRTLITGGTGFLGRNLAEDLIASGREVLIIGRTPPKSRANTPPFESVDIRDGERLTEVLASFHPTEVIHLAAQTDFVTWDDPAGFHTNTEGTRNVLRASAASNVDRLLIASSHVALRQDQSGQSNLNYASSKLAMESIVRDAEPSGPTWTIIRPCSLWGPWFRSPYLGFFLSIAKGRYFDLGRIDPPKRLGFVGNTCYQVRCLLEAPAATIRGRTFYLADYETTTIQRWSRMIAGELKVRSPKTIPEAAIRAGARVGDLMHKLGYKNPPLTSFRLTNMRTDTSLIPIDEIKELANPLPFTLEQGVRITVNWLRETGLVK